MLSPSSPSWGRPREASPRITRDRRTRDRHILSATDISLFLYLHNLIIMIKDGGETGGNTIKLLMSFLGTFFCSEPVVLKGAMGDLHTCGTILCSEPVVLKGAKRDWHTCRTILCSEPVDLKGAKRDWHTCSTILCSGPVVLKWICVESCGNLYTWNLQPVCCQFILTYD